MEILGWDNNPHHQVKDRGMVEHHREKRFQGGPGDNPNRICSPQQTLIQATRRTTIKITMD